MKNLLYILSILLLYTSCKQDTPFPPGLDADQRFKKITSYNFDTITDDTIKKMVSIANYDAKGKVSNVKMYQDNIEIRNIDFDYPSSNHLTFNVTPKDFYQIAVSGGVVFDETGMVKKTYDRNKSDFGSVNLYERLFTYQAGKLATTHIPSGDAPESYGKSGYNYFEFAGNLLMRYRNASTLNDSTASFFFLNLKQIWRDIAMSYYPNNNLKNNLYINIDEYYEYETSSGVISSFDFFNPPFGKAYDLAGFFQLIPFMPRCNFLGVEPNALVKDKTVTGHRSNDPNSPIYYKLSYNYEFDNQNRVIKKEVRVTNGHVLRVWYYEYEG